MNENERKELDNILNAAASRPRPVLDYPRMPEKEFVILWHYERAVVFFSIMVVRWRACRSWLQVDKEWDEIHRISAPLTRETILNLAKGFYDPRFSWVLAECMSEQPYLIQALEKRFAGRQITKNFLIIPKTMGTQIDISRVEKLLQIDKIRAFPTNRREYETNDLKQRAMSKVSELIAEESQISFVPLPRFPQPLPPDIQQIWDTGMAETWRQMMGRDFGIIKAGFLLRDDVLRQKVRGDLRSLWRKTRRQKALLGSHEEVIRYEVHPELEEKIKSSPDVSAKMVKVLKEAKQRWGDKALKAFKYYLGGKTEKEAAKLAGIGESTFRAYIVELRKILSSKET